MGRHVEDDVPGGDNAVFLPHNNVDADDDDDAEEEGRSSQYVVASKDGKKLVEGLDQNNIYDNDGHDQ